MATNKIVLKDAEQFMADYEPTYIPFYPAFMSKSQAYPEEVGTIDFKRVTTVGDIRAKHITPKDTEIKQFGVAAGKKTFKKYFLANQFTQSELQDSEGIDEVIKQVLDEHQKHMDEIFLLGEGTSNSTVLNNGLYWSADPNYLLEASVSVLAGADADHLKDMHTKIMATVAKADLIAGRKVLVIYGETACSKYDSLYKNSDAPFKTTLQNVLGGNYSVVKLPLDITPASANGWIVANLDQVKLHYVRLPGLKAQGTNEEKMYSWHNFLMGSCMLDVVVKNGVIRQPVTFA